MASPAPPDSIEAAAARFLEGLDAQEAKSRPAPRTASRAASRAAPRAAPPAPATGAGAGPSAGTGATPAAAGAAPAVAAVALADIDPAARAALTGDNPRVALLGPAGSGKTTAVTAVAAAGGLQVLALASTNVAALVLGPGAKTLASQVMRARMGPGRFAARVLAGTDLVAIDECSMVSVADLEAALGWGLPVVLCGDFAQLAGVPGRQAPVTRAWLEANGFEVVELAGARRAADAPTREFFAAARGLGPAALEALCLARGVPRAPLAGLAPPPLGARAHVVVAHNADLNALNAAYAAACGAEAAAAGAPAPTLAWGCGPRTVRGPAAPGMLVVGVAAPHRPGKRPPRPGLANQEIGVLVGLSPARPAGRRRDGRPTPAAPPRLKVRSLVTGRLVTVPAPLANPGWALTFHRTQGQTFDCPLAVKTSGMFDSAMLYVAVTRIRRLGDLTLVHGDPPRS